MTPRIVVEPAEKWAAFRTRARGARGIRNGDTRTGARRRADRCCLPRVAHRRRSSRRLIAAAGKLPSVILANLVIGENVIPEFLQCDCTPGTARRRRSLPLLSDTPQRHRQIEAFGRLDAIMAIGGAAPSAKAAAIVLDVASAAGAIWRRQRDATPC